MTSKKKKKTAARFIPAFATTTADGRRRRKCKLSDFSTGIEPWAPQPSAARAALQATAKTDLGTSGREPQVCSLWNDDATDAQRWYAWI